MSYRWNKEQLQAIETIDTNILISASAGAGKTTVLVSRLMKRMLVDQISIDRILAVTFTEAAAAEMKKRLIQSLNEDCKRTDLNSSQIAYRNEQLVLLQTASICTLHSFCLSLIKNYYYVISLDPARINRIFDDNQVSIFKQQALDQVFKQAYDKDAIALNHCLQYFSPRCEDSDELRSSLLKIAQCASTQFTPFDWLEQIKQNEAIQHFNDLPKLIRYSFFEKLNTDAENYLYQIEALLNYAQTNLPNEEKQRLQIKLKQDKAILLREALRHEDYPEYQRIFFNSAESEISSIKEEETYKKLRADLQKTTQFLCAQYFDMETYLSDLKLCTPLSNFCCDLAADYLRAYEQIKKEQGGIDFDDMEHFAYQILLAEEGRIAALYQQRFDEIMVDEFQDTNAIQNAIIQLISKGKNIFRVGDIKQSIYKFRGAQPKIMQTIMQNKTSENCVLYLSNNYRSKKNIVDFNNTLFDSLMNIKGLNSQYLKEDHVGIGISSQEIDNPFVEVHLLKTNELQESDENQDESLQGKEIKANYIAQQILTMKKESPFKQWKDYVVLVRSHQVKIELKQAFDKVSIPYFIDVKSGFYQSDAVIICLSFLKFLINPQDILSLSSILLSPFFDYTDEKTAQFSLFCAKKITLNALRDFDNQTYTQLNDLILFAQTHNIVDCLSALYKFQHFYEQKLNQQQRTNCDLLFQKACSHLETENSGFYAFIDELSQVKNEKTSETIPVSNEDDVVKVMTIHQSKGLQFPVVLFWSTSKQDILEKRDFCLVDASLGLGLHTVTFPQRYKKSSIQRIAIEHKMIQEELEEQIRVLYVALTRAQNKLIIVDNMEKEVDQQPLSLTLLFQRKGMTSLILSALSSLPNEFFKLVIVNQHWEIQSNQPPLKPKIILPRYPSKEMLNTMVVTPSSKESLYISDLSLTRGLSAMDRGTLIHKTLEELPIKDWTHEMIHDLQPLLQKKDIEGLLQFQQSQLFTSIQALNVEKEVDFILEKEGQLIHGVMDLVAYNEHQVILIDYKSDLNVTSEELIHRYSLQLNTYFEALLVIHPHKKIQAYIYSISLSESILVQQNF